MSHMLTRFATSKQPKSTTTVKFTADTKQPITTVVEDNYGPLLQTIKGNESPALAQ